MCGGQHWIRECTIVDDYTKARKSKKNQEGKIVLSSGAFVPRDIPGRWLMNRIDEWHKKNPNQLATTVMVNTINKRINYAETKPELIYQLSTANRIATLEAELFNLHTRKHPANSGPWTRSQKDRAAMVEMEDEEEAQGSRIVEVEEDPDPKTLEHPFRSAKDAVYIPPTLKNVGTEERHKPTETIKKLEPVYKSLPPVHNPRIASNVYK